MLHPTFMAAWFCHSCQRPSFDVLALEELRVGDVAPATGVSASVDLNESGATQIGAMSCQKEASAVTDRQRSRLRLYDVVRRLR